MNAILAHNKTRRHPDYRLHTDEELRRQYRYLQRQIASVDEDITEPLDLVIFDADGWPSVPPLLFHMEQSTEGMVTVAELRQNARAHYRLHLDAIIGEIRRRVRAARIGVPLDKDTFPRAFLDDLKRRVALDELFSYELGVTLGKPNGRGVRRGPCPFCKTGPHSQALMVSIGDPGSQYFLCFACGASGDAIDAVAAAYGLSFVGSVRRLAANGNIPLPTRGGVR